MRAKKFLGVASASAAVGAALIIPASMADAGTTYNSTATATPGSMSIQGNNVPITTGAATATDANPNVNRSQSLKTVASTLSSINSQLGSAAEKDIPPGADLIAETATASPDGTSSACSAVVVQGCVDGKPQPVTINTAGAGASGMSAGPTVSGNSGVVLLWGIVPVKRSALLSLPGVGSRGSQMPGLSSLPGGAAQPNQAAPASNSSAASALSGYSVMTTGYGPTAVCTAGPAGTSGPAFTANSIPGTMTVNIFNNGKSIFPNGPVTLKPGNVLAQLPLDSTLTSLVAASGIKSVDFSSTQSAVNPNGPETSATGGEESLSAQGQAVMDIKGGKATCGPNKAGAATPTPSPTSSSGTGGSGTGSSSTSGSGTSSSTEKPLGGGIQTDEGRSGFGYDDGLLPVAGFPGARPGA